MNDKREGHSARSASKTEITVGDFCCYVKKRCLWSFFSKWIFFIIIIFKNCHHYFNLWQCYYFQDRLPGLAEHGSYWTGRQRPLINSNVLNLTQNITLLKKSVLECSHLLRLLYKQGATSPNHSHTRTIAGSSWRQLCFLTCTHISCCTAVLNTPKESRM